MQDLKYVLHFLEFLIRSLGKIPWAYEFAFYLICLSLNAYFWISLWIVFTLNGLYMYSISSIEINTLSS